MRYRAHCKSQLNGNASPTSFPVCKQYRRYSYSKYINKYEHGLTKMFTWSLVSLISLFTHSVLMTLFTSLGLSGSRCSVGHNLNNIICFVIVYLCIILHACIISKEFLCAFVHPKPPCLWAGLHINWHQHSHISRKRINQPLQVPLSILGNTKITNWSCWRIYNDIHNE